MAYKVNSIGGNAFISLSGEVDVPRHVSQVIARQNVADISTRILAKKGRTFQLTSVTSASDESAAHAAYETYAALINSGLQVIVQDDVDYSATYGVQFKVLEVVKMSVVSNILMVGNVGVGHTALLTCIWSLVGSDTA